MIQLLLLILHSSQHQSLYIITFSLFIFITFIIHVLVKCLCMRTAESQQGGSMLLQSGWCHTHCIMCPRLSWMRSWGWWGWGWWWEATWGEQENVGVGECAVSDERADLVVGEGQLWFIKRQDILENMEKIIYRNNETFWENCFHHVGERSSVRGDVSLS